MATSPQTPLADASTLRLTTIGRRTGEERNVMVGYIEDGSTFVTMAMNGWGEGEPAWWLNLPANPATKKCRRGVSYPNSTSWE